MKVKFLDYYNIASNLVLCTFVLGFINVFVRGLTSTEDLIIAGLVLVLRYFSAILIKRRFAIGKYLLLILIARNIYKLCDITVSTGADTVAISLIVIQIIMTVGALVLITKLPAKFDFRKKYIRS
ncbi:hypothetical protein FA048_06090 [Pedobacter polaris]|uniref:Uncharacterized protein n=1 Tax=Pedobacter polaris TaxID=2571273 RepID=A0A4U1CZE8_9SPHI|nr:hypothetical protein [Pedobacter polaris]TKC13179.1 hypothetical protein FA048_06090 [Pedobacter polaris]